MRIASSSGVHLEFSFSRLSPKEVDIGGVLLRRREEVEGCGLGGSLVRAFSRDRPLGIYVLDEASLMREGGT